MCTKFLYFSPADFQNNWSASNNYDSVTASVEELVRTKCVVEVPFVPKVVNPLSVSTNTEEETFDFGLMLRE